MSNYLYLLRFLEYTISLECAAFSLFPCLMAKRLTPSVNAIIIAIRPIRNLELTLSIASGLQDEKSGVPQ